MTAHDEQRLALYPLLVETLGTAYRWGIDIGSDPNHRIRACDSCKDIMESIEKRLDTAANIEERSGVAS